MEHISGQKCVPCANVTGPTHEYDINGYTKRQCHPYALGRVLETRNFYQVVYMAGEQQLKVSNVLKPFIS